LQLSQHWRNDPFLSYLSHVLRRLSSSAQGTPSEPASGQLPVLYLYTSTKESLENGRVIGVDVVGADDGRLLRTDDGSFEGVEDGLLLGTDDGSLDGLVLGMDDGSFEGPEVSLVTGEVGSLVGRDVGRSVVVSLVGRGVGRSVGFADGEDVGSSVRY